jgi:four helix bundle protein
MKISRFEQLDVRQAAHVLALDTYRYTRELPRDERFGLLIQMRWPAETVPANIAEGFKRRGAKDKIRFYNVSQASLEELNYYLILCGLDYGHPPGEMSANAGRVAFMLTELIRSAEAVQTPPGKR